MDEYGEEMGADRGAQANDEARAGPSLLPELAAEKAQVLKTMDGRGGWHADALMAETGLSASKTATSLILLQLAGRIRDEGWRSFAPT